MFAAFVLYVTWKRWIQPTPAGAGSREVDEPPPRELPSIVHAPDDSKAAMLNAKLRDLAAEGLERQKEHYFSDLAGQASEEFKRYPESALEFDAIQQGCVWIGRKVTLIDVDSSDVLKIRVQPPPELIAKIGHSEYLDFGDWLDNDDREAVSAAAPLGQAILFRFPGDAITVHAPGGVFHYRIDAVSD